MSDKCQTISLAEINDANMYAWSRVLKEYCSQPDLMKKICPSDKNCLQWKPENKVKTWPDIYNLSEQPCNTDANCKLYDEMYPYCLESKDDKKKFCGFKADSSEAGICEIATEKTCLSYGKTPPFTCDNNGCKPLEPLVYVNITDKDTCNNKKKNWNEEKKQCEEPIPPYLVWKTNESTKCDLDRNLCRIPSNCDTNMGLCNCKEDNDCWGTAKCEQGKCKGGSRCLYGNYNQLLWCEYPISRCQPDDDGNIPGICRGNSHNPGVVDVPPFKYDPSIGKCSITPEYCKKFNGEYEYNPEIKCKSNDDCGVNTTCYNGRCLNGDCSKLSGWIKYTIGQTLYGAIDNLLAGKIGLCPDNEQGTVSTEIVENYSDVKDKFKNILLTNTLLDLSNIPEKIEDIIDDKFILHKEIIISDFIKGINLYMIVWNPRCMKKKYYRVGFIYEEIYKNFPGILKNINGDNYIYMKRKQLTKQDRALKRIYLLLAKSEKITDSFEYILKNIPPEINKMLQKINENDN